MLAEDDAVVARLQLRLVPGVVHQRQQPLALGLQLRVLAGEVHRQQHPGGHDPDDQDDDQDLEQREARVPRRTPPGKQAGGAPRHARVTQ